MVEFEGTVERITYFNPDNYFTIARMSVKDNHDMVTLTGYFPSLEIGEVLRVKGKWVHHKNYGYQFKVNFYETLIPSTAKEIETYLASGVIKGIGPVTAAKIVERFGEKSLEVIEKNPEELLSIDGIGLKKMSMIAESFEQQRETREVMLFLQQYGIGPGIAVRIYKNYKDKSIEVIKQNPYRLADEVYGIGFRTADKIAIMMGIEQDAMERLEAGIKYTLLEASDQGHTYLPKEELLYRSSNLLKVKADLLESAVLSLTEKKQIIIERLQEGEYVYLAGFFISEKMVARRLFLLSTLIEKPLCIKPGDMEYFQNVCGIKLAKKQKEAVEMAARSGVLVITGGPGTGKTTTIRSLIGFYEKHNMKVALAAPTGRAAKRMAEATGKEAKTIHRLLDYKAYEEKGLTFGRNCDNPLEEDVIIVDEISMVDIVLMHHLLAAIRPGSRLVLVGDKDQLPSVGPGSVLREIIQSAQIPIVILDEIFRQAKESLIVVNAHRINKGFFPYLNVKDSDFYFEQVVQPEQILEHILDLISRRLKSYANLDPIEDIQVITPMKKGTLGVFNLNQKLQGILNPKRKKRERSYRAHIFREGDKVMQLKNNYDKEVFNGDLGKIVSIDEDGSVFVSFASAQQEIQVAYSSHELDELSLAYALSVHKSQGSEFPAVIMPITTQHYIMLQRNLLYTAITRAKKYLVLVGTKQALCAAIKNNKALKRYGRLSSRIIQEFSEDNYVLIDRC
ncbi:MAG: ATP-dependent RecD-like DNA helicase [Thermoanaerobacterales bacterium]|nr:ATP-dependent RecD-like DNA helicase [Thermoanaerobacterales bacterium]